MSQSDINKHKKQFAQKVISKILSPETPIVSKWYSVELIIDLVDIILLEVPSVKPLTEKLANKLEQENTQKAQEMERKKLKLEEENEIQKFQRETLVKNVVKTAEATEMVANAINQIASSNNANAVVNSRVDQIDVRLSGLEESVRRTEATQTEMLNILREMK